MADHSDILPYVDIAALNRELKPVLMEAIEAVLDHGNFVFGPEVAQFEQEFANLCRTSYAVGLNSGTDALVLALKSLNIGPGDEVITVPNSFIATTAAIRLVGARPVFVDVAEDMLLDVSELPSALTNSTKAILPVHLTGRPCRMDEITNFARTNNLRLIEDAAQAILSSYDGKKVGSFGDIGCFSLHPLKTLSACGDGGVATCNDPAIYERLCILRNIGLKTREDCREWSGNSRLDTLQAAILLRKLQFIENWTEQRRLLASTYREELQEVSEILLPPLDVKEYSTFHTFVVQTDMRDKLRLHLASKGIGTSIHYPVPIHLSEAGKDLGYGAGAFPVAERQASRILSLPIYQTLNESHIKRVSSEIRKYFGALG